MTTGVPGGMSIIRSPVRGSVPCQVLGVHVASDGATRLLPSETILGGANGLPMTGAFPEGCKHRGGRDTSASTQRLSRGACSAGVQ